MYKFVLDADGLIKLTKSGIMQQIVDCVECLISDDVYKEVVIRGKERLYEDAFIIEELIEKEKTIKVKTRKLEAYNQLSLGEVSTLQLYKNKKADGIISDDRKFLSLLESEGVPFIVPTHLIVMLVKLGKIRKQDAINALEKTRVFVREDAYLEALQYIRGDKQ